MKSVRFLGDSQERLRAFPKNARKQAGYELERVQNGLDPNDWKPIRAAGPGVREIRVRDASGAFRVIYVANLKDFVFVLHAFQKKTERTTPQDIWIAKTRSDALRRGMHS
jgi:phage-related protein